jgi:phosphotriesterase-related protein
MKGKFLVVLLGLVFSFAVDCQDKEEKHSNFLMTVKGPIDTKEMGITLTHEHVLVDLSEQVLEPFFGADKLTKDRDVLDYVLKNRLPHLRKAKEFGCNTFVDCTTHGIGRDPELLKRVSNETGMHIIASTGYFGAFQESSLPSFVKTETADQLTERIVKEWENGIEDTGIKPGLIKIGIDPGKLSETQKKIARAVARAHLKTGLTIASHSWKALGAFEQIEILKEEGVNPTAFIWVHASSESNVQKHIKAAEMGAWVSFDQLSESNIEHFVRIISNMRSENHLNRVLLSHDSTYILGLKKDENKSGYSLLFEELIPTLKKSDFTEEEIEQMIVTNPQNAFACRVRPLKEDK